MATDAAMDVDDMELVFDDQAMDEETARLQREIDEINASRPAVQADAPGDAMAGVEDEKMAEEGEVTSNDLVPTKVHVRGVNDLTTRDVQNFAADLYPSDAFKSIEWIDDTSANLVYDTKIAASEALTALSVAVVDDPLELRPAKPLVTHPQIELFVRMAMESDRKQRGAAKVSEFYQKNTTARKRRLDQDDRSQGRSRFESDRASYRRQQVENREFSADLYDDDAVSRSSHSERELFPKRRRRDSPRNNRELFADRPQSARFRNRSASPTRDGDGRYGFSEDQPHRASARYRSPPPRRPISSSNNYDARETIRNELFPDKKPQRSALASESPQPKELFPDKANHRRQDAKDIPADEVADAIGAYQIDGAAEHRILGRARDNSLLAHHHHPAPPPANSHPSRLTSSDPPPGRPTEHPPRPSRSRPRELFPNGGPSHAPAAHRPRFRSASFETAVRAPPEPEFSIRGGAAREQNQSFSIVGAASRAGGLKNGGRDLFEGKGKARRAFA